MDSHPTELSLFEECAVITDTTEASCISLRDNVEIGTQKINILAAYQH